MRLAATNASIPARAQAPGSAPEKQSNPYLMDEVQLNSAISDAENKAYALGRKEHNGQNLSVVGSGVALAGMAALIGSSVIHPGAAQMVATAGTMMGGVAVFCAGIWQRDSSNMDRFGANLQLDTLTSIRDGRTEKPEEDPTKWLAAFPTLTKLWDAEGEVRRLSNKADNGQQLSLFGKSLAVGTALTTAGVLFANHGHEPIGALIATAATGAGSAAAWIAGRSSEKNSNAALVPARAQVQTLQQEYANLMA